MTDLATGLTAADAAQLRLIARRCEAAQEAKNIADAEVAR